MTNADLEAIVDRNEARKLLKARASPGEWHEGRACDGMHDCFRGDCHNVWRDEMADVTSPCAGLSKDDALFIAHARNDCAEADVDALLAEVLALHKEYCNGCPVCAHRTSYQVAGTNP